MLEGHRPAWRRADTFLPNDCTLEQLNLAAHEVLVFKRAVHTDDHRVDASDPALLSLIWHQVGEIETTAFFLQGGLGPSC